tara:strand:+ start:1455 stop:2108 length:654 start_codon:yes stop_codon:yes gene_type:complete
MGRSDPHIFNKYLQCLGHRNTRDVIGDCCFLGFKPSDSFPLNISSKSSSFFDLSLGNWNINDKSWNIPDESFNSIICTRTAYFARDPLSFFKECNRILKKGGFILVDWGIGDHWRFPDYKIGWIDSDDNQEWAYNNDNFLWSFIWNDRFVDHPEYSKFSKWVEKLGYNNVKDAIFKEVPSVLEISEIFDNFNVSCDMIALWEDSPQLYVIVLCDKTI